MLAALLITCAATVSACGKKGPPLAPIAHVPAAVDQITARRVGRDIYLTVTVPIKNIDASMPADVTRVEVYGVTSLTPPPRGRFLELATVIATIAVAPAPRPNAPPVSSTDPPQGAAVTVRDSLTADALVPKVFPVLAPTTRRNAPAIPEFPAALTEAASTRARPTVPRRYYMALGFSERGRPGPQGAVVEVPLAQVPDAPASVTIAYNADVLTLSWPPSGGIVGFLTDRAFPIEAAPFDEVTPLPVAGAPPPVVDVYPGPTRYQVYRTIAPDPLVLPTPAGAPPPQNTSNGQPPAPVPWGTPLPVALTPQPLDALTFADTVIFHRERCYEVRATRGVPPQNVEGDPSPRACVTPIDTFPPAPPSGLTAVAAEGAISLLWEPNIELDLGGYIVLRGRAGDATLLPLTDTPIAETRFTDKTVMPGVRYVYAVEAVDSRLPLPNVSAESPRVEEIAR